MTTQICDFLLDITQNSIEAGASLIEIAVQSTDETLTMIVSDNGKGMSELTLKKAFDPFYSEEENTTAEKSV